MIRTVVLAAALLAPYLVEAAEVAFASGGYRLVGTLDRPGSGATRGGIVVIPGAGPVDREGVSRITPHRPQTYRHWAEALTQAGFAVLRYDKRLLTFADIDYSTFDEEAQINDAFAAVSFLRLQPGVRKVYLLGHSEGGTLATVMANRSADIAGIALVNSVQFPIDELLMVQIRNLPGITKAERDEVQRQLGLIRTGAFPKGQQLLGASGAYWTQWIAYSRRSTQMLSRLEVPVLLVQCLNDESLPGGMLARNLEQLRSVAKANENAQLRELAGHDHSGLRRGELRASPQFTRTLVQWFAGLNTDRRGELK